MAFCVCQDRLSWQHQYQGCLEELYALGDTPVGAGADAQQSFSEQARQEQQRALEVKLAKLERKHAVPLRWIENDRQYQDAAGERKRYMIRQLHSAIAARFLDHYALRRQFDTAAYRERSSLKGLRRQMGAIVSKIGDDIVQLQRWHAAPGEYHGPSYDPQQLDAAGLIASDTLPWQRQTAQVSLLARKVAALEEQEERSKRCSEELQIIRREARDMHLFYRYYMEQVRQAIARLEETAVAGGGMSARQVPGAAELGPAGVAAALEAFRAGQIQVLRAELLEYRRLGAEGNGSAIRRCRGFLG